MLRRKWHVTTRIPYFNYSKVFDSFEEAAIWAFNSTGISIQEEDGKEEEKRYTVKPYGWLVVEVK
jgi:hypothetical protein